MELSLFLYKEKRNWKKKWEMEIRVWNTGQGCMFIYQFVKSEMAINDRLPYTGNTGLILILTTSQY